MRTLAVAVSLALVASAIAASSVSAVTLPPASIPMPTSGSFLYLNSEPGSWVGNGLEQVITSTDTTILGILPVGGDTFRADIHSSSHSWNVFVAAPRGVPLAVGSYTGAVRAVARVGDQPGLDVSGDGRGCNTLTGSFDVREIAYSEFQELAVFDATFVQRCDASTPALYGRIRIEVAPPAPHVALPPGAKATTARTGRFG